MRWPRAIVSGVVIVAVAFGILVVVPDLIVSDLTSFGRSGRVACASLWFAVTLVAMLWGLRRLQSKGVI